MDSSVFPDLNTLIAGATVIKFFEDVFLNLSSGVVSSLSEKVGKQLKDWVVGKKITDRELQEEYQSGMFAVSA